MSAFVGIYMMWRYQCTDMRKINVLGHQKSFYICGSVTYFTCSFYNNTTHISVGGGGYNLVFLLAWNWNEYRTSSVKL